MWEGLTSPRGCIGRSETGKAKGSGKKGPAFGTGALSDIEVCVCVCVYMCVYVCVCVRACVCVVVGHTMCGGGHAQMCGGVTYATPRYICVHAALLIV